MKRLLRKTPIGLHVSYSNENFTNNLWAADIYVDDSGDGPIRLSMDLTKNLRVRNKSANCYYDAMELVEESSSLDLVQIDDDKVIEGIARAVQRSPGREMELELVLEESRLRYQVGIERRGPSLLLRSKSSDGI